MYNYFYATALVIDCMPMYYTLIYSYRYLPTYLPLYSLFYIVIFCILMYQCHILLLTGTIKIYYTYAHNLHNY